MNHYNSSYLMVRCVPSSISLLHKYCRKRQFLTRIQLYKGHNITCEFKTLEHSLVLLSLGRTREQLSKVHPLLVSGGRSLVMEDCLKGYLAEHTRRPGIC